MQYNGYKIAAGLHGNVPGISSGVILLVNNGVLAEMHVTRCRPLFLWHQSHDIAISPIYCQTRARAPAS